MRRGPWSLISVAGAAAHHLFERRAGLGLPLQPYVGRRAADVAWSVALGAWASAAVLGRGQRSRAAVAAATGAGAATVAVHFAEWPWRWWGPLPVLTEAEGLPDGQLPIYNTILLGLGGASVLTFAQELTWTERGIAAANAVLSFWPARLLARHHFRWLGRPEA